MKLNLRSQVHADNFAAPAAFKKLCIGLRGETRTCISYGSKTRITCIPIAGTGLRKPPCQNSRRYEIVGSLAPEMARMSFGTIRGMIRCTSDFHKRHADAYSRLFS